MTQERKDELYDKMFFWICERVQNDWELFGILHDEFGMTKEELHDHSIESLDGCFPEASAKVRLKQKVTLRDKGDVQELYEMEPDAKAIAEYLIQEGVRATTTGNWNISFEEINEQYDTNLPADRELLNGISRQLYDRSDSVADFCISEEGVELDYYYGQCPNYCGDDEDMEESMQPQL